MTIKIKKIEFIPGHLNKFKSPALVFFIEFNGNSFKNECISFYDLYKKLGGRDAKKIDSKKILVSSIALIGLKIFKSLRFPIFTTPRIEILTDSNFKIFFPVLRGCEKLSANLLIDLFKYVTNSTTDGCHKKKINDIFLKIRELKESHSPRGKNTLEMLRTANEFNVPWNRVHANIYQFGEGSALRWFDSSLSDGASSITTYLLQNKFLTTSFLGNRNFPVPQNYLANDENQAISIAATMGFPVVIKPQNRDRGEGVTSLISSEEELRIAFVNAKKFCNQIIVEKHLEGRDFRLHVMKGRVYRVRERVPGGVIGDGCSDITTLVARLNSDPKRGAPGSNSELIRIDLDQEAYRMLEKQNFKLSDVPNKNQYVRLRSIANVSMGGLTKQVPLEMVHKDNILLAEFAVKALNIDIAAVDFITPNIEVSWKIAGGGICEINHKPQFGQDAIRYLFENFFPSRGRISSILIVGDFCDFNYYQNLKNELSRHHIRLGFASSDGAWLGNTELPIFHKKNAFNSFHLLLQNREVDAILVKWDRSFSRFGIPTLDFLATCVIGNIPLDCSLSEISDLSNLSERTIATNLGNEEINKKILELNNITVLKDSQILEHELIRLFKSRSFHSIS